MSDKSFKIKTVASALAALAATAAPIPVGTIVAAVTEPGVATMSNNPTAQGAGAFSNLKVDTGEHFLGFTIGTRADGTQFAEHASHSSHSSHSSHHSSSF